MTAKNIHQRLHAAMNDVDYVQREKKPGMRYTIVSHDAVTAKVRPVLVKHGIVYYPVALVHSQNGNRTEVALTVRFANIDNPGEFIDVPGLGYGIDVQVKGPGKAISYAVKYCLLKALGLETGDDPDLEQEVKHEPPEADGWKIRGAKLKEALESALYPVEIDTAIASYGVTLQEIKDHSQPAYERLMKLAEARKSEMMVKS